MYEVTNCITRRCANLLRIGSGFLMPFAYTSAHKTAKRLGQRSPWRSKKFFKLHPRPSEMWVAVLVGNMRAGKLGTGARPRFGSSVDRSAQVRTD